MERIKVAIRVKPEAGESLRGFNYLNKEGAEGLSKLELPANGTKNEFTYDHIFGPNASQREIFETVCAPIINTVLEGFNGTLFAYGQTGAGKTHTVTGPAKEEYEERGLCMRTVEYIFRSIKSIKDSTITVRFSVIEIYNDNVMDLLRESLHDSPKLVIVDTPNGVIVPALYLLPIESEEEAFTKLYEANLNRSVAEHQLNRRSSRSHVIYSFYITRSRTEGAMTGTMGMGGGDLVDSKLHLVDLAGSERIEKTGSTGGLIKEATHINKSLSFLEQVVLSLTKKAQFNATLGAGQTRKADFIPAYRQSKLTYILKDSLGGNCNTVLVCCVWPHANHLWETLSSLRFASRMRCIENHPQRNSLVAGTAAVSSSTRGLQLKIEALRKELAMRDVMCGYAMYSPAPAPSSSPRLEPPLDHPPVILETLTKTQLASCQRMTSRFVLSGDERDIDVRSLAEVKAMATFLRSALWSSCGGDQALVQQILKGDAVATVADRSSAGATALPSHLVAEEREGAEEETEEPTTGAGNGKGEEGQLQVKSPLTSHPSARVSYPPPREEPPPAPAPHVALPPEQEQDGEEGGRGAAGDDPFSLFKRGEGLELHERYEELKRQLREAKARQKSLVKQVNQTKIDIDSLSDQLQTLQQREEEQAQGEGEGSPRERQRQQREAEDQVAVAVAGLSELKAAYKQTRSELIFCKEDIVDLNRKKQIALNALVSAYESYVSSGQGQGEQEQREGDEESSGNGYGQGAERAVLEGMVAEDLLSKKQMKQQRAESQPLQREEEKVRVDDEEPLLCN